MEKKKLIAVITGGKNEYGALFKDDILAFGSGETVEEAKESLKEGLRLLLEEDPDNIPDILKGDYEIIFTFDVSGALKYYSGFMSYSGLSKVTGIHQKQLSNYANGFRKPNKETADKIQSSLHRFGNELSQVQITF